MNKSALITTDWLLSNLTQPNLVILDASLPKPKARPEDNPLHGQRIPGARFFDIEHKFSDTSSPLPHTMVSESHFNIEVRKLGINNDSLIVIYDNLGVYASPRAWWMFRSMGHENMYILDGGLPKWVEEKKPIEPIDVQPELAGNFTGTFDRNFFRSANDVLKATMDQNQRIVDARSAGRFAGTEPEPRAGLRGGHIPGSISLPFTEVLDNHSMKSPNELKTLYEQKSVSDAPLIFSCGSGLTACIIALAAYETGFQQLSVYDGSWSEWGQDNGLPVEKG